MHADAALPVLVGTTFVILLLGLALRRLKQPHVVAYLVAGVVLGPHALAIFTDRAALSGLGDLGVVLLLFFIGMEMPISRLAANWRVAVIGTGLQIAASVLAVWTVAFWMDWPLARIILLGFVISLSSTGVVVAMLKDWGEMDGGVGQDAMGILIVQDLAIVPMLLVLGWLAGDTLSPSGVALQAAGGVGVLFFSAFLLRRERLTLPFGPLLRGDHELQVFAAALLCLGFALITSLFHLSTALGAFLAGIVVASSDGTDWVARSLEPLRVVLMALFFVSIGLIIDVRFLLDNLGLVGLLLVGVLVTNTLANAGIVRVFGRPWRHALVVGALLAQIGEFSFVLAAIGRNSGVITDFGYQATISVIFASLVVSPIWVRTFRTGWRS